MTDTLTLSLSAKFPWWVQPYLYVMIGLAFLGVPINIGKVSDRLARHIKVEAHG